MELLPLHKLSAKHYTAVLRGLYILLENAFVSLGRGLNLVLGSKLLVASKLCFQFTWVAEVDGS